MFGIKELHGDCRGMEHGVAQAPDGLFLSCVTANGVSQWLRGDATAQTEFTDPGPISGPVDQPVSTPAP